MEKQIINFSKKHDKNMENSDRRKKLIPEILKNEVES